MSQVKKSSKRVLGAACALFLVFLTGSLLFVFSVQRNNEKRIVQYLEESTGQRRDEVLRQIESDLQLLRGVAVALEEFDVSNLRQIEEMLDTINKGNTFVRMGLADTDGQVDLVDIDGTVLAGVDLSGMEAFRQALAGVDAVSPAFYDAQTGQNINYYTVPVIKDGEVAAVLCAVNTEQILLNILSVPVFQGEGYFAIVDDAGVIVAPVADPNPEVKLGASIFDLTTIDVAEKDAIRQALAAEELQDITVSIDDEKHLGVVVPMGMNGWSVISVAPLQPLLAYYSQTALGTSIIIAAACLAFLFLLFGQIRNMASSNRELERLAYTDPLTGLRNYTKLMIDAKEIRHVGAGKKYAVWSFDIKKFNSINDIFGIDTGDKVLRHVAEILDGESGRHGICCRIAADQFAGLRPYKNKEELTKWFRQIYGKLSEGRVLSGSQMMQFDISMGVYCVDEFRERLTDEEMVNRASIAKKTAKEEVGSQVRFFTREMGEALHWETELESCGQAAIDDEQVVFFLQPKVGIRDGLHFVGAEALARWIHPEHGMISPTEFIPLFENKGYIVELDRFIFERACSWLADFYARTGRALHLSVNVSRQGILREDFVAHYSGVKEKYGIADKALELEFTESIVIKDTARFKEIVRGLQQAGFVCAIDDFGSGYSSLNVLKNLPIDVLKLDVAFFRDSEDIERERIVIENFITMAQALSIKTVSEGVETAEQVRFLQRGGCDMVQGYVFSKPLPLAEFEQLILNGEARLLAE